jgi:palmitoyltransferase ZDHHC9/14/18
VEEHDHHCAWVGACVGRRNYRAFFCFLLGCVALCLALFAACVTQLVCLALQALRQGEAGSPLLHAFAACPFALVLVVYSVVAFSAVVGLFGYHVWLCAVGMTTHEHMRGTLLLRNPYDSGSVLRNLFIKACRPQPPPYPASQSSSPSTLSRSTSMWV